MFFICQINMEGDIYNSFYLEHYNSTIFDRCLGTVQKCQHFHKCTNHMLGGEGVTPDVRF